MKEGETTKEPREIIPSTCIASANWIVDVEFGSCSRKYTLKC